MAFNGDFRMDLRDLAVSVDNEGRTNDPHVLPAIKVLFLPDSVSFAELAVFIDEQGERKVQFGYKFFV